MAILAAGASGINARMKMEQILTDITYSGTMLSQLKVMSGKLYAVLILESSGTLTVSNHTYTGDVCLIGGGGRGAVRGAGGGYVNNYTGISIVTGAATIGAGSTSTTGQGGTTTALGNSAIGGYSGGHSTNGGNGGCGGGAWYTQASSLAAGTGQGTTTRPFSASEMEPQAGGGGGGGAHFVDAGETTWYVTGGVGGTNGGNGGNAAADYNSATEKGGNGGQRGGKAGTAPNGYIWGIDSSPGYGGGSGSGGSDGAPGAVMIRIEIM